MLLMLKHLACVIALLITAVTPSLAQDVRFDPATWTQWNEGVQAKYPDAVWSKFATPEDAGWSTEMLNQVRAKSEALGTAAMMIVLDGVIVAEWGDVERRFMGHSLRKSLLSALYGIAVKNGQINLDDSLNTLKIDDRTPLSPQEKRATVADLLKSRSGIYLPAAYETENMKRSRPGRNTHQPGSHWYYNNWDFNALGTIYNRETKSDLFAAFKREIAEPLQMQDFDLRHTYYHLEAEHSRHPAYPFRLSARDLARFGVLYLNEGMWKDQAILSPDWVAESTASYSRSQREWRGYGYMWWRYLGPLAALGAYEASGAGGHRVVVVPGARVVIVHRTNTYDGKRVSGGNIRRLVNAILGARVGPVRAQANLISRPQPAPLEDPPPPPHEITALLGTYQNKQWRLEVTQRPGGLMVSGPRFGRFNLRRTGARAYTAEDARYSLSFQGGAGSPASALKIGFSGKAPAQLTRVP